MADATASPVSPDVDAEATKKLVGAGLGLSIVSEVAARADARAGALNLISLRPPCTGGSGSSGGAIERHGRRCWRS
jgi:DNA-binding transcriptional LysR family regulator